MRDQLDKKGTVMALALHSFKGMLGHEINPDMRLGTEISDYAKMAGVHGIIHSDEDMNKYGFTEAEIGEPQAGAQASRRRRVHTRGWRRHQRKRRDRARKTARRLCPAGNTERDQGRARQRAVHHQVPEAAADRIEDVSRNGCEAGRGNRGMLALSKKMSPDLDKEKNILHSTA